MSKRKRDDEEINTKRFKRLEVCQKRKFQGEETQTNKRLRSMDQYVEQMDKENKMMRDACFQAGETIDRQRRRIAELETLLTLQRTQMHRLIVNNNITVY